MGLRPGPALRAFRDQALARRPGHITAAEHVEMQVVHALLRLLCPIGLPPAGVPFHFTCSGRVNRPCAKVFA